MEVDGKEFIDVEFVGEDAYCMSGIPMGVIGDFWAERVEFISFAFGIWSGECGACKG